MLYLNAASKRNSAVNESTMRIIVHWPVRLFSVVIG